MCLCVLLSPCHVSLCSVIPLPRAPVFCQPPSTRPCVLSTPFHAPQYSVISLPHVFVICPPPSMCFCVLSSPCHASLCSVLPLPCVSVFCCRKFILRVPELPPPPPSSMCATCGQFPYRILHTYVRVSRVCSSTCSSFGLDKHLSHLHFIAPVKNIKIARPLKNILLSRSPFLQNILHCPKSILWH